MKATSLLFLTSLWIGIHSARARESTKLENLSIAIENSPNNGPWEFVKGNKPSGIHIELIERAAKASDINIQWVVVPWSRALAMAEFGKVDAVSFATETKERKAYLDFPSQGLLHTDEICVVIRKGYKHSFDGQLSSLYGQRVGLQKNYVVSEEIENVKRHFNLVEVHMTGSSSLDLLKLGRFDYTFTSGSDLSLVSGVTSQQIESTEVLKPCFNKILRYLGFSKKRKLSEARLQSFLKQLEEQKQNGFLKEVLEKYKRQR